MKPGIGTNNNWFNEISKQIIANTFLDSEAWRIFAESILFIGGSANFASVQIRCIQIALGLQCDYHIGPINIGSIPASKRILILVKPDLSISQIEILNKRFILIWDLHDWIPSYCQLFHIIICSSKNAAEILNFDGDIWIIPHHHCNFNSIKKVPKEKKIHWIGRRHWMPNVLLDVIDYIDIKGVNIIELISILKDTYIGVNFRASNPDTANHIAINPGVKAINYMGFGIPNLSPRNEPAYAEWATDGTIFCDLDELESIIRALCSDMDYYKSCSLLAFECGKQFHISIIVKMYLIKLKDII